MVGHGESVGIDWLDCKYGVECMVEVVYAHQRW